MIVGVTLHSNTNTTGDTYYSPWLAANGNLAQMACQVLALSGTVNSFKIQVETKNSEDSDKDAVPLLGTPKDITLTAGTTTPFEAGANLDSANQGVQELFRFVYTLVPTTDNDCWIHFVMLTPGWLPG